MRVLINMAKCTASKKEKEKKKYFKSGKRIEL